MRFSDVFDGCDGMPAGLQAVPHQRGNWFFVPTVRRRASGLFWYHRHAVAPLARFLADGTTAAEVVRVCARSLPPDRPLDRPIVYVRGRVEHPGQPPLEFPTWHRAFRLPTRAEVAARFAVWRHGGEDPCAAGRAGINGGDAGNARIPVLHRMSLAISLRSLPSPPPGPGLVSLGIVATVQGDTEVGVRETLVDPAGVAGVAGGTSRPLTFFTCTCGLPCCAGYSPVRIATTGGLATWRWQHGPWLRRAVFDGDALRSACMDVMRKHRETVEQFELTGVDYQIVPTRS